MVLILSTDEMFGFCQDGYLSKVLIKTKYKIRQVDGVIDNSFRYLLVFAFVENVLEKDKITLKNRKTLRNLKGYECSLTVGRYNPSDM